MLMPPGVHVEWVDGEAVVLNESTSELHYLNPQSALIYALLLEYGMPAAVAEAVSRTGGPRDEVEKEVEQQAAAFIEKGILDGAHTGAAD